MKVHIPEFRKQFHGTLREVKIMDKGIRLKISIKGFSAGDNLYLDLEDDEIACILQKKNNPLNFIPK